MPRHGHAVISAGPFAVITVVCIMGSANLYYALGIYSIGESFVRMWRMIIMMESDVHDLEKRPLARMYLADDNRTIHHTYAKQTEDYLGVVILLVILTFIMGLSLMNIFIAVLGSAYNESRRIQEVFYQRHVAHKVIEAQSIRTGFRLILDALYHYTQCLNTRCHRRYQNDQLQQMRQQQRQLENPERNIFGRTGGSVCANSFRKMNSTVVQGGSQFLWVCHRRTE
jgi:hypothetical protein